MSFFKSEEPPSIKREINKLDEVAAAKEARQNQEAEIMDRMMSRFDMRQPLKDEERKLGEQVLPVGTEGDNDKK